ncbi:MAG: 30S ribosomal protein S17 [Candidatus Omnitrophica bacterium]|nr:30S ribosomal protein S17 [Candidatus Omnitrophota bacterium]
MGKRKEFIGQVVSDKMQKTAVVKVVQMTRHRKYSRIVKVYNKFKAHNPGDLAKVGDSVRIEETRPLSKDKRFRVVEVLEKAKALDIEKIEEIK